ncbi:MAG: cysteine-rich small domain-containing protein [Peptococcaceae bacterium]|jgi:Zn-finger protein|nr:cysteine-rich small domain-containing protein [Peptococcaceae bacterium]
MNHKKELWQEKSYAFFSHKECEAFPCHETDSPENFNCLFCYCPLYLCGDQCGGHFIRLGNGVKSCERCLIPHERENYGYIIDQLREVIDREKKKPSL